MAADESEWKELMLMLVDFQKQLSKYAGKVDYPLGNARGIAYNLASIVRQARLGVRNGDYDSSYVGQKNKAINMAVRQWEFRLRNDLERSRSELGEEYSVNE